VPERLHCGYNPNLDIPSALSMVPADEFGGGLALLSMIDSTPRVSELPSLVPLLQQAGAWYSIVDFDIVVATSTLVMLASELNFLSGFDEIWLCDEMPTTGKPAQLRLTSDVPIEQACSGGLESWMTGWSCRAGLGDGDGLNFITADPNLSALWRPREA
jgi:hypothetical protein